MAEPTHPLLLAIDPLINRIGAAVVDPSDLHTDDVALHWDGEIVAGIRLPASAPAPGRPPSLASPPTGRAADDPDLEPAGGLDGIIADLEGQLGSPLANAGSARQATGGSAAGGERRVLLPQVGGNRRGGARHQPVHRLQLPQPGARLTPSGPPLPHAPAPDNARSTHGSSPDHALQRVECTRNVCTAGGAGAGVCTARLVRKILFNKLLTWPRSRSIFRSAEERFHVRRSTESRCT